MGAGARLNQFYAAGTPDKDAAGVWLPHFDQCYDSCCCVWRKQILASVAEITVTTTNTVTGNLIGSIFNMTKEVLLMALKLILLPAKLSSIYDRPLEQTSCTDNSPSMQ